VPDRLDALDTRLLMAVRSHGHTPARDHAVAAFSKTGEHAACWLALGAVMSLLDHRPGNASRWRSDTVAVAASFALNTALKLVVHRPRPQLPQLPPLTSTVSALSFPSAHATTSFAAARLYGARLPATPLVVLGALFSLSRLYLGVHYPSDVVAGALLGTAFAIGVTRCR
jgi:membrane-associated phospholipid phosphatase